MAPHMDIKMNGSKQHVVLALLLLVLSVGYTSRSVLSSSSMLTAQQGQENVTQDKVAQEQVQQECDEEGASLTVDCNICYCLNGHLSCSNTICLTNSEPLETDTESPQNSTKAYEDRDYEEDPECVEGTRWTEQCNICECSFGQALCTIKTCIPECVHGSSWVDDCNTCRCYEGIAECSDRTCLSDSATTCKEGSSWTQDCNTCFCSNGITSCSKEICPAEETTETTETTTTKNCNGTFAGCMVIQSATMQKIIIPSELNFCIKTIKGQLTYFAYLESCYKQGKLACAYCEGTHKYNARTCKCHKKSRFRGSK